LFNFRKSKYFDVVFREKPAMLLVTLLESDKEIYASTLAKTIDCTYSHVVKLLKEMNKAGLIVFQKRGRLKILTLTKKGEKLSQHIREARSLL